MKRLFGAWAGWLLGMTPALALAEGATGYSRGNATLYFAAITAVLIYGIYDVFRIKWLTWVSAIVIPVVMYLNLPAK
jgi:hypothetical protein